MSTVKIKKIISGGMPTYHITDPANALYYYTAMESRNSLYLRNDRVSMSVFYLIDDRDPKSAPHTIPCIISDKIYQSTLKPVIYGVYIEAGKVIDITAPIMLEDNEEITLYSTVEEANAVIDTIIKARANKPIVNDKLLQKKNKSFMFSVTTPDGAVLDFDYRQGKAKLSNMELSDEQTSRIINAITTDDCTDVMLAVFNECIDSRTKELKKGDLARRIAVLKDDLAKLQAEYDSL